MAPFNDYEQYQLLAQENDEPCEPLSGGKSRVFGNSLSGKCYQWRKFAILMSLLLCLVASFGLGLMLGSSKSSECVSAYSKETTTAKYTRAYSLISKTFTKNAKPALVEHTI